ncbi:ABC transporter substrate-binding protein [Paenibacillus sp. TRM 82003]|uniref:ABC transporter substrate-binding protein n=1 Tax=Kineococcus sp. TRM81007 TaxID=2925831 RepID=UPI001F57EBBD|nr:ABC transporter substrate-binding protein [Kineococcus sp. TRM81007]MCI2239820.1 ABC transporter substrate-binding protein [Kineococcus sp. TRM81007]MCI3925877.1 ABC transporter substrate-binding protein [Paenibacillus sp. TRM 82003]
MTTNHRHTPGRRAVLGGALGGALTGLSACAFTGDGSAASGGAGPSGPADHLVVWFPGTNQTEIDLVTGEIVPAFEERTGATVDVTYLDWGDMSTKLNAAFAAGTAPDVFGHGPAAVADFAVNDRLEDLGPYLELLEPADLEDMDAALPGGRVDGTQYLVPLSIQGSLIAYRAGDFREAGLDPDDPPRTWEDLLEVARRLTVRDGAGTITRSGLLLMSDAIGRQQSFAALLASAGGRQVDGTSPATAAFDSPAGATALDYLVTLFAGDPAVAADLGQNYSDLPPEQQPLVTGRASMTMSTAVRAQSMHDAHPELDLRVMQPLAFSGGEPGVLGGAGPGLMINKDSAAKELAWEFISHLLQPEVSGEYTRGIGAIPVRASSVDDPYVQGSPVMTAFVQAADAWVPNPNVPGWVQARDTLSGFLEQALNERLTPEEALAQAAPAVDEVLAKAARAGGA